MVEKCQTSVTTIPLKHRVPCAGFLFREKPTTLHLNREMADFYGVPVWQYNSIKDGEDFITADGTVIPNSKLTLKGREPRSYAYCCDTMYDPSIVPLIHSSTLLYHDSTYGEPDKEKAVKYFHSTAAQAAEIAKAAGVERLMLGHFSARYSDETVLLSEAQAIFPETMLARETLTVSISG